MLRHNLQTRTTSLDRILRALQKDARPKDLNIQNENREYGQAKAVTSYPSLEIKDRAIEKGVGVRSSSSKKQTAASKISFSGTKSNSYQQINIKNLKRTQTAIEK